MTHPLDTREYLEADGLGGYASGTSGGIRTRRYHALLVAATTPPTGRMALVNGVDAVVAAGAERLALTSQHYASGAIHPAGASRIEAFTADPWPTWTSTLPDGARIEHELMVVPGTPRVLLRWRAVGASGPLALEVRPFLSGRDDHALHHENGAFRFDAAVDGARVSWRPYDGVPGIAAVANGTYTHEPHWYRSFLYAEERARGLDHVEDLGAPGVFRFDLAAGPAVLAFAAHGEGLGGDAALLWEELAAPERARRAAFASRLHRAADSYVVRRGGGRTIVAGYPWFTDWGRDTFIALRGLGLAAGRLEDVRAILLEWSAAVQEGLLPNRFPDRGDVPEFNAVDASLWFVVAVHEYLEASPARRKGAAAERARLAAAVEAILEGHTRGTRHGIRMDADGLLAAGEPGVALTWMDARVGGRAVTPRIGKPVEVQALWINALRIGSAWSARWLEPLARATASFARFWNEDGGFLFDVVDAGHVPGTNDSAFRPNQVLAVGGLPFAALADGARARRVVDAVEARLLTPMGLRSLAPDDPAYVGRYAGGVVERDGAYHQGTVWPWLMGPFVEAWVRVHGGTREARAEARRRFLDPLLARLDEAGLGHLPEIADGDAPHRPGGCPFQAWSVGEALRLDLVTLGCPQPAGPTRSQPSP